MKRQAANDDRRALALAIDQDAAGQLSIGQSTALSARALAACRVRQVTDYRQRLATATDDRERRKLKHEGESIADAIRRDVELTDKVVGHQADLARVFTQARAMAEARSEAEVLANQKPAYQAMASTVPLQLPATSGAATVAPAPIAPPPPPPLVLTTLKSASVRDAPSPKAKTMMTFSAHHEVRPKGERHRTAGGKSTSRGHPVISASRV